MFPSFSLYGHYTNTIGEDDVDMNSHVQAMNLDRMGKDAVQDNHDQDNEVLESNGEEIEEKIGNKQQTTMKMRH